MTNYRFIETESFGIVLGLRAETGEKPELKWLPVNRLVINKRYQRDLLKNGRANIVRIAQNFDWKKFSTLVVAPVQLNGEDHWAIIDGQHRCTAAALRKIWDVPCQIVKASAKEQAEAFASINSVRTNMSTLQIHAAKVMGGDEMAVRISKICEAVGVEICRYPVPAKEMKPGQTLAVSGLYRAAERYGVGVLALALRCITVGGVKNIGLVSGPIFNAYCDVLRAEPSWMKDKVKLLRAAAEFDLAGAFRRASISSIDAGGKVHTGLIGIIGEYLSKRM